MALLTKLEAEILQALNAQRRAFNTPYLLRGCREPGWCRPRDIGAMRQSHHANTLARLTRKGMVERRPYGGGPSFMYRINARGALSLRWYLEAAGLTPDGEKNSARRPGAE